MPASLLRALLAALCAFSVVYVNMDSTNKKGKLISGSALKDKVAKIKRKRILSNLKITLIHFVFLASIVAIFLFGNWLFAVSILIMWLALLLSF
jgi:hypothetical protein